MGNTVKVTLESFRGPAGYSPTIQTVETDAGLELTIADVSGTKTVTIRHGAKGDIGLTGEKGERGEPGAGLTETARALLLMLFENAAYGNADMQATLESLKTEWGGGEAVVVPVASVSLNKSALTLTEGESETLTATVKPDNATSKTVSWSVSPADFATVSGGVVTAVKAGACTVTATCGGKSASCAVTVEAASGGGDTQDIAGETPVYKLAQATEFTPAKANAIDTGVKMFETIDPKPTYTILFEVQYNDSLAAKGDTYVLMHCMEEASPWPGFVVQVLKQGEMQFNLYGYNKVMADMATLKAGKRRFAVQFADETVKAWSYNGNYLTGGSPITNYTTAVAKSLILGGYQTTDGVKGRYFDGVLSACLVYDKALTSMQVYNWIMG